jgi:hypothetical protein
VFDAELQLLRLKAAVADRAVVAAETIQQASVQGSADMRLAVPMPVHSAKAAAH